VFIPKGSKTKLRPLGIPTVFDRVVQALYNLGLDPVVEASSYPNSYGLRKKKKIGA